MNRPVSDADVAAYRPLCRKLASHYAGRGGAEFDDLEQEGLIAVWDCLRSGFEPSKIVVANRMRDWIRKCRKRGFGDDQPDAELFD